MTEKIVKNEIALGVVGVYIPTTRFKTARLSVEFELPLAEETASANALLPFLLTGCSKEYPTSLIISRRLDNLYGANLECSCEKRGDSQVLKMSITSIENKYSLDDRDIVGECADMLISLIFNPLVENDRFDEKSFQKERRLMVEKIDGEINNKRNYALYRCESELLKGEPASIARYGSREGQLALTSADIFTAWKRVLSTAFIRVGYLAAEPDESVFDRFKSAFATIERQPEPIVPPVVSPAKAIVSEIEDRMAVNQGKLVLGFRSSSYGDDRDTYRLMVLSDLFGGGPYSLLFDNVREKMSLCYYCASRTNRRKGFLTVDSGVEFANMDKTYDEILNQLNRLKNGDFDDSLLDASKKSLCESFRALGDSQSVIDRYYADRVHSDNPPTPDEMGELVRSVTRDDIIHVANSLKLDTVYRLKSTEEMKK